jgi:uncharacterized protein
MRYVAALLLCCTVTVATAAPAFPGLTGRVVDLAGILSPATEADLVQQLAAHERASGVQLVVATLITLDGMDPETYGNELARHWQLGQQGKNNGILFFAVPAERVVRIEVGYGLEGDLTDALAANIIQTRVLPHFRNGDYDAGVRAGVAAIFEALGGEYLATDQDRSARPALPIGIFWIVLVFILLSAFGGRRGRRIARAAAWGVVLGGMGGGRGGGGGGGFRGGGGSFGGGGATGRW